MSSGLTEEELKELEQYSKPPEEDGLTQEERDELAKFSVPPGDKGLMEHQKQEEKPAEFPYPRTATLGFTQGFTSEGADELEGAFQSLAGDQTYDQERKKYQDLNAQAEEANPILYGASYLGGSLANPLNFSKKLKAGGAAIEGGIQGFLGSEGGIGDRLIGAAGGAAISGASSFGLNKLVNYLKRPSKIDALKKLDKENAVKELEYKRQKDLFDEQKKSRAIKKYESDLKEYQRKKLENYLKEKVADKNPKEEAFFSATGEDIRSKIGNQKLDKVRKDIDRLTALDESGKPFITKDMSPADVFAKASSKKAEVGKRIDSLNTMIDKEIGVVGNKIEIAKKINALKKDLRALPEDISLGKEIDQITKYFIGAKKPLTMKELQILKNKFEFNPRDVVKKTSSQQKLENDVYMIIGDHMEDLAEKAAKAETNIDKANLLNEYITNKQEYGFLRNLEQVSKKKSAATKFKEQKINLDKDMVPPQEPIFAPKPPEIKQPPKEYPEDSLLKGSLKKAALLSAPVAYDVLKKGGADAPYLLGASGAVLAGGLLIEGLKRGGNAVSRKVQRAYEMRPETMMKFEKIIEQGLSRGVNPSVLHYMLTQNYPEYKQAIESTGE